MKTLRFDSVGGASGDMILAALLDLGVDRTVLAEQLASLGIEGFRIETDDHGEHGHHHGAHGMHVTVHGPDTDPLPHRRLRNICELITASRISAKAKELSIAVFERLAAAEAHVHGTTPDDIHFHEVGAIDSIVDIVGGCVALDLLGASRVVVGTLPLGSGTTTFSHGVMPVPVPATVELLKGHPVVQTDEPFELVTPTGAALLMTWQARFGGASRCGQGEVVSRLVASGIGLGRRKLNGRQNLLRCLLFDSDDTAAAQDLVTVLECNLDDTVPELIGGLVLRLMDAGALDVFTCPVQMKKQRPGTLVTVLCRPCDRALLLDRLFRESTTFGVREHEAQRTVLPRRHETVDTAYGQIRVKVGTWQGVDITRAPEYEDCVRASREHGVSVRAVYEAALRAD